MTSARRVSCFYVAGAGQRATVGYGHAAGERRSVFIFFSNRLGCAGSLLVSAILTIVLLVILWLLA